MQRYSQPTRDLVSPASIFIDNYIDLEINFDKANFHEGLFAYFYHFVPCLTIYRPDLRSKVGAESIPQVNANHLEPLIFFGRTHPKF